MSTVLDTALFTGWLQLGVSPWRSKGRIMAQTDK